jgi:hypothetical protein
MFSRYLDRLILPLLVHLLTCLDRAEFLPSGIPLVQLVLPTFRLKYCCYAYIDNMTTKVSLRTHLGHNFYCDHRPIYSQKFLLI